MKVLLVAPAFGQPLGHYYTFPLGMAYISSALKRGGHEVSCLNLNHYEHPWDTLFEKLRTVEPDVVGTGGLSPHYTLLRDILATSKAVRPEALTIIGGGAVSSEPELILGSTLADIGIIGEGEITAVELLNALESGRDLHEIAGIIFKSNNGQLCKTPMRPAIKELDAIPWPDYDGFEIGVLLDSFKTSDAYHLNFSDVPRALDLISSRSCPYPCTFCFHPLGKTYRERSLDNFFAELDYVVREYKINQLSIMDELFAAKMEKLVDFCHRIKPYKIAWTIQLHVSTVDDGILQLMRDAGCTYISYGIESMNDQVLTSMRKNTCRATTQKALQMTYDAAIGIQGNLIFGDPSETLETAYDSLSWWSNNRHFQINCISLGYYPGSKIYEDSVEKGIIRDRLKYHQSSCPLINATSISDSQLGILRLIVDLCYRAMFLPARNIIISEQPVPDRLRGRLMTLTFTCIHCGATNQFCNVPDTPNFGDHCATQRLSCRTCNHRNDIPTKPLGKEYPYSVDAMAELAVTYWSLGEREAAVLKLKANFNRAQDHPLTNHLLGDICCETGNIQTALTFMSNAMFANPYSVKFVDGMAKVLRLSEYSKFADIFVKQSLFLHEWQQGGLLAEIAMLGK